MVIFSSCRNIRFSNIRFEGSPNWTIAFLQSEDVKVSGISISNNMSIPNSDGIDMYDSKNITISDCVIQAGDDAIAVISSSNITVTNCILHSRSCGIRVGYNVFNTDNSGNLLFNNIAIYDSNRGIGIFQRQKGNMENMIFSNMIIHTRLHTGGWWGHGEPIHISSVPGLGSKEPGTIRQVHFSHIVAESESGIVVYAGGKGLIQDIYFDDIDLTIKQSLLAKGYGGNIDLRPVNEGALAIFGHTLPALYSVFTEGLAISHLHVRWGAGLPAYFTHAVECRDYERVSIGGVEEQVDLNGSAGRLSTVYLHRGMVAHVKDVFSTDDKKKLVEEDDKD
jgi:Glycosyl hydrolases family 28